MPPRRKKDSGRSKQQLIEDRRDKVRGILKTLGLWGRVQRINFRKPILDCYYPKVSVGLTEGVALTDETAEMLRALGRVAVGATAPFPPLGERVLVTDLISYLLPLYKRFQLSYGTDPETEAFLAVAGERLRSDTTPHVISAAVQTLYRHLDDEVAKYCRIDGRLYHLKLHAGWNEKEQWTVRFAVHQEPARRRTITTETGPRAAHWCGAPFGTKGIDWVQWPRSFLGGGDGPPLPVFVQGHALDNLYRDPVRARLKFIQDGDWMVHDYLWQSLREPVLRPIARQPGKYLVEYRLNMHKLGYLVVRQAGDVALVETFLFLTMDSTPEGDLLWRKLRLARKDKMELELDDIRTFLMTDLQFDRELVSILEDCGCGHLFQVVRDWPRSRCLEGYAEDMRKYLGLGTSPLS
jgi:hypothetical protein